MYFNDKDDSKTNIDSEFNEKSNSPLDKKLIYIVLGIIGVVLLILLFVFLLGNKKIEYYLVLDGNTDIIMYKGSNFTEPGYRAYDSKGNDYTDKVLVEGDVDTSIVGEYTIKYSFNNIEKTRTVTISSNDRNLAYLSLKGDKIIYLKVGDSYEEPGWSAIDSGATDVSDKVNLEGTVDVAKAGTYIIKYTYVSSSNVTLTDERVIIVMDSEISLSADTEQYVNSKVTINGYVSDNYLDYVALPNGGRETNRRFTYDVTENGTYKFVVYSKSGLTKEASIEIKNIDKVAPTGKCEAIVEDNTSIMVEASDDNGIVGYSYSIDGVSSGFVSDRNYVSLAKANTVTVEVKDSANNVASIKCSVQVVSLPSSSEPSSSFSSSSSSSVKSSSSSSSKRSSTSVPSYPSGNVTLINTSSYNLVATKNDVLSFAKTIKNRKVSQDQGYPDYCLSFAYYYAYLLYAGTTNQINSMTAQEASEYTYATKFQSFKNDSKLVTLQKVYDLIKAGQPVILHVNGKSATSRHYVTVVGIKKTATRSNIKETDLLILDVVDAQLERMDVSGSRFMITGYDTGRTGSSGYGYQLYVLR